MNLVSKYIQQKSEVQSAQSKNWLIHFLLFYKNLKSH